MGRSYPRILIAGVAFSLACSAARAELTAETMKRASLGWNALICSAYADNAGMDEQSDRLFKIGYDNGKAFLDAVTKEDIPPHVPDFNMLYIFAMMNDRSTEFRMGMAWYAAATEAENSMKEKGMNDTETAIWKRTAADAFKTRNCALL